MELPGCLWFCHLSGDEQVGLADIVKYLGLCTLYSPGDWKMGHVPCDLQTLASARRQQPKAYRETGCNVYTLNRDRGPAPTSQTSPSLYLFHLSFHLLFPNILIDAYTMPWPMPGAATQREKSYKSRTCGNQNKARREGVVEGTWVWGQADVSLSPGSPTY